MNTPDLLEKGLISKYKNKKRYYTKGDLDLSGCTSLKSLPDDLKVGLNLHLEGCSLYPFDTSKFTIVGNYKIIERSLHYIMED